MHFEIVCITLKGLRSWMMDARTRARDGFLDPMGRTRQEVGKPPREQVNIEDDYIMFFLIDDILAATGICNWMEKDPDTVPAASESAGEAGPSSAAGPSQTSGTMLSVDEQIQQMGLDDGSDEEPTKKKKKKKKKSKAEQSSQASASSFDDSPQLGPVDSDTMSAPEAGGSKSPPQYPSSGSPEEFPGRNSPLVGPSSLPNVLPSSAAAGSPSAASDSALSSSSESKMRVVLSARDIEKMRRSFEAGKARREARKRDEQRLSSYFTASTYFFLKNQVIVAFIGCLLFIICVYRKWSLTRSDGQNDVYLEFLH